MSHAETYGYDTSREPSDVTRRWASNMHAKKKSLDRGRSVSPSDNNTVQVGLDGFEVVLIQDYNDATLQVLSQYAQAASVGAPPDAMAKEEVRGLLEGGLAAQSLEDIRIAFAVRGASRVLTHQLVRTRAAAFKQQSQRDCDYGNAPEFRMPESVWAIPTLRDTWLRALRVAHRAYVTATQADIPFEDARYILPEGTTNFILLEYSLRTFRETYAYRGCIMFQDEMVYVFREMRRLLVEAHPYLDRFIRISCETTHHALDEEWQRTAADRQDGKNDYTHHCTFQGREPIEEACDFPWARETNRAYVPPRYLGE